MRFRIEKLLFAVSFCVVASASAIAQLDPLPSWNDGSSKRSITDFVAKVTRPGSADYVPVSERIATFDNDGTLWAEQPMYFQFLFAVDRVKGISQQHPEWRNQEPFKSLLAGDTKMALSGGENSLLQIVAAAHSNITTDEFDAAARAWLATARHPKTNRSYYEMVYQPMVELLVYLRSEGFKTYIVSGGGVDFMRSFAERTYGIPPELVIGSTGKLKYEMRDGKPALLKVPGMEFLDDKEGKPVSIHRVIGRRPVMAFGNSDGDLEMLQWTAAGAGPRFVAFIHHTDGVREWAYDRTSSVGRLDKGLDEAKSRNWTVVDMKSDWKVVYASSK
jgi:phosphoserine phosphatase